MLMAGGFWVTTNYLDFPTGAANSPPSFAAALTMR
jgi:hypothetical protein